MRTRFCTLLLVGLLLVTTPVLAAPDRAAAEEPTSVDTLLHRLLGPILSFFGADEGDVAPRVDPSAMTEPPPEEADKGPGVDPDGFSAPADPDPESNLLSARGAWRR